MRMRGILAILLTFVGVALVGVLFWNRLQRAAPADDGRLRVVTTFLPLYSFTAAIAGEDAAVENLLPQGVGPHDFAFAPSDIERLARADVVVANGLGLEEWLADAIRTANPDVTIVEASAGIATRAPDEALHVGDAEEEEEEEHGPADPHVWLDPVRAQAMVQNITLALVTADPSHRAGYEARADALDDRLAELDAAFRSGLAGAADRRLVAFHDAFGYLAERYGLETVAVVEPSPGKEPSPRDLAQIVSLVRRTGVRALFTEPQFSPAIVETIAAETGRTTHALDPLETGPFTADAYFDVMRANLAALQAAFGIRP